MAKKNSKLQFHLANITGDQDLGPNEIGMGEIIRFNYEGEDRYAFVLNPTDTKGLMHALALEDLDVTDLYKLKHTMGQNLDITPQLFYNIFVQRNKNAFEQYRTFDTHKIGKVSLLSYKFGLGGIHKLDEYQNMREYTDLEFFHETGTYFDSPARRLFQGLASTRQRLIDIYRRVIPEYLPIENLRAMENSALPEVLRAPDALRTAVNAAKRTGSNWKDVKTAIANNDAITPPIIVFAEPYRYYMLAGRSRSAVAAALGFNLQVKLIHYDTEKK